MKIEDARITLRPRSLSEVLDLALLVTTNGMAGISSRLAAIALLPMLLGALAMHYLAELSWMTVMLTTWLYASFIQGLFTVAIGQWLLSAEDPTVRTVLREFGRHLGRWFGGWLWSRVLYLPLILWAGFVAGMELPLVGAGADTDEAVGMVLLGMFCAMMGMPAHQSTLFLYEAVLLEQSRPSAAIKRSRQFVRAVSSRSWSAALMLVTVWATILFLSDQVLRFIVEDLLQTGFVAPGSFGVGGSPYLAFGLLVAVPVLAVTRFLLYIDGRTRVDGWDVQVKFMALAAQHEQRRAGRAGGTT